MNNTMLMVLISTQINVEISVKGGGKPVIPGDVKNNNKEMPEPTPTPMPKEKKSKNKE